MLPVFACRVLGGTCPNWFSAGTVLNVRVAVGSGVRARLVDERGRVVGRARPDGDGAFVLKVPVEPESAYLSPALAEVPYLLEEATLRHEGAAYRIEFHALPGSEPGAVQGEIRVTTTVGPGQP